MMSPPDPALETRTCPSDGQPGAHDTWPFLSTLPFLAGRTDEMRSVGEQPEQRRHWPALVRTACLDAMVIDQKTNGIDADKSVKRALNILMEALADPPAPRTIRIALHHADGARAVTHIRLHRDNSPLPAAPPPPASVVDTPSARAWMSPTALSPVDMESLVETLRTGSHPAPILHAITAAGAVLAIIQVAQWAGNRAGTARLARRIQRPHASWCLDLALAVDAPVPDARATSSPPPPRRCLH